MSTFFSKQNKNIHRYQHKYFEWLYRKTLNSSRSKSVQSIRTIYGIGIFLGVLLLIGSFTPMKQISPSPGAIIPKDSIPSVDHLEGGRVEDLWVKDGQYIQAGDPVLSLNPESTLAQLEKLKAQLWGIELEQVHLYSKIHSLPMNKALLTQKGIQAQSQKHQQLIENTLALHHTQTAHFTNEVQSFEDKIHALALQIQNYSKQLDAIKQREDILEEQLSMFSKLSSQQYSSKLRILDIQDRFNDTHSEYLEVKGFWLSTQSTLTETKQALEQFKKKRIDEALQKLTQNNNQGLQLSALIQAQQKKADRLILRSPFSGIVKGLSATRGSVIAPGETVFEVVPLDTPLMVQAKVSPKDIAQIALGDPVQIKISAYPYSHFGHVYGQVTQISPSSFDQSSQTPYFEVIIALNHNYIGPTFEENPLIPGMTVTADIITGHQSFLGYLLDPIIKTFAQSMNER